LRAVGWSAASGSATLPPVVWSRTSTGPPELLGQGVGMVGGQVGHRGVGVESDRATGSTTSRDGG